VKPGVVKPWVMTLGRVAGQVPDRPQAPGSPYQWPTDEPYSVIASKELGLYETMLSKEYLSTLASINGQAREIYR
jgi:hypothetical protein